MPKIMITGANGLIGQALAGRLASLKDCTLLATSLSACRANHPDPSRFSRLDITDIEQVDSVISEFKPDVVIHGAAITDVDPCELDPETCERVNIEGTRHIVQAARSVGARILYLSTDFVFDGTSGPYREEDEPNPVSQYGWSKLQGEYIVRASGVPWAIARTILVYGVSPFMKRNNLVTWVYRSLKAGKPIRVVSDQFRMPTLVDDLADGIIRMAIESRTGIFHLSGPEMLSVYDFSLLTARHFHLDESLISPVTSAELDQPGKRPPSTGFVLEKAARLLDYRPKKPSEGLVVVQNLLDNLLD